MRRILLPLAVGLTAAALAGCSTGPDVTRARVEGSVGPTFANLFSQRADLLGVTTVTPASTAAQPTCHRMTPGVGDTGPGADWICMIAFLNGSEKQKGKFEVQVHANSCWTASGPSKLIGGNTITAADGREVDNPVFAFDGCFDPDS